MKRKKDSPIEDTFPRSLTPDREADLWRTCVRCTLKKLVLKNVACAYEKICRDSFSPNPSSPGVFDVDPRTMADLRMAVRAFWKHVDAKKAPTAKDTKTLLETVIRACERRSQRNTSSEPEMNNRMELIVFAENRNLFSGPADKADCAPFEICDIAPLYQRVEPQVERILKKMEQEPDTYWRDTLTKVQFVSRVRGKRRGTCYTKEVFDLLCDYDEFRTIRRMKKPRSAEEKQATWNFWKACKKKLGEPAEWMDRVSVPGVECLPDEPDR